jgi:hypothetical protein
MVVPIVDSVSFDKHALMKDPRNQNASGFLSVEHNMLRMLHTSQARPNFVTSAAHLWIVGQPLATCFEIVKIPDDLVFAP